MITHVLYDLFFKLTYLRPLLNVDMIFIAFNLSRDGFVRLMHLGFRKNKSTASTKR